MHSDTHVRSEAQFRKRPRCESQFARISSA